MYQINSKLAAITTHWPFARVQQHAAEPRRPTSHLRAALAGFAKLAVLRVMPGSASDTTERHDPRAPGNW